MGVDAELIIKAFFGLGLFGLILRWQNAKIDKCALKDTCKILHSKVDQDMERGRVEFKDLRATIGILKDTTSNIDKHVAILVDRSERRVTPRPATQEAAS